jgi:hypothetical protein
MSLSAKHLLERRSQLAHFDILAHRLGVPAGSTAYPITWPFRST